ncbi:MAG: Signal recognition particle-docking protein FtsY [uncultured bacterium]|nr:MAG: Signal recognition particle-docking protein FtsY [uncultured bacterium]
MFNLKYFDSVKKGLAKTSSLLKRGVFGMFSHASEFGEEEIENLEKVLIESDIGVDFSLAFIESLRNNKRLRTTNDVKEFLKACLMKEFLECERNLFSNGKPGVILFIGINGSGKTTSISKVCTYLQNQGKKIMLAAGDTFRAAAIEQISIWAERLNAPLVKHKMGADPAAVAHDACESAKAKDYDYVLIDSAGRLHNQISLMEELKKIVRVTKSRVGEDCLEILLVIDGNAGQNSFVQAQKFKETVGINGIIITKLDGTAKGGIIVSIEKELKIPIKFIGVGEQQEDLIPFSPELFVEALLKFD